MFRRLLLVTLMLLGICLLVAAHGDHDHHHDHDHDHDHEHAHDQHVDDGDDVKEQSAKQSSDLPKLDPEEVEYHKGSLCGYCEYCKVALLRSWQCPLKIP